jgi:hypothetical protein
MQFWTRVRLERGRTDITMSRYNEIRDRDFPSGHCGL